MRLETLERDGYSIMEGVRLETNDILIAFLVRMWELADKRGGRLVMKESFHVLLH